MRDAETTSGDNRGWEGGGLGGGGRTIIVEQPLWLYETGGSFKILALLVKR